jgi:hypothetical protein
MPAPRFLAARLHGRRDGIAHGRRHHRRPRRGDRLRLGHPGVRGVAAGRRGHTGHGQGLGQGPVDRGVVGQRGHVVLPKVEVLLRERVEVRRVRHRGEYNGRGTP